VVLYPFCIPVLHVCLRDEDEDDEDKVRRQQLQLVWVFGVPIFHLPLFWLLVSIIVDFLPFRGTLSLIDGLHCDFSSRPFARVCSLRAGRQPAAGEHPLAGAAVGS
jgi:hypothetical protein